MRISSNERDSGFAKYREWRDRTGGYPKLLLDGVHQRGCITADEELGEMLVYVYDEGSSSRVSVDWETGEIRKAWRRGKVEIVWPET